MKFHGSTNLSTEEKKERRKELAFGVLSGLLIGFSFPPVPYPVFIFVAFVPYFHVLEKRESLASINRFTYLTLFCFNLIALYWVGSWTKEADPFLMISGAALIFFNPLVYLIVPTLYYFSKRALGKKIALFLFPFYWVSFEYIYSITDLRFPWLTLGNSLPHFNTFIQIADITGVYGLTLIAMFINIFIYKAVSEYKRNGHINRVYSLSALSLFLAVILYGVVRINSFGSPAKTIKVGLIQPDLNPWEKWSGGNLEKQLNLYLDLSDQAFKNGAKMIIWPESALPVYLLSGNYDAEVGRIMRFVRSKDVFLLTGMPDINFYFNKTEAPPEAKETRSGIKYTSYNSILMFSPYSFNIQKYAKIMLVPFGEHVPFVEKLPLLGDFIKWEVGISSWNIGTRKNVFNLSDLSGMTVKIAGVVCIESIYPDFVTEFTREGAELIVVVTNDSWYGNSSGPYQHKEISALRAVENRKTVVRAANGGISCIIDPLGRTISETGMFTKTVFTGDARIEDGITFYARFPWIIPIFSLSASGFTLIYYFYKRIFGKKRNRAHEKEY
jgi:apolipoprotein N-acyltransferase